jgi:hypothetical protein
MAEPYVIGPVALSTDEDRALIISGIHVEDADGGILSVSVNVELGWLTLSQTSGLTFFTGDGRGDQMMQFSGAIADINAALAGASFRPFVDATDPANIDVTVNDDFGANFSDEGSTSIPSTTRR